MPQARTGASEYREVITARTLRGNGDRDGLNQPFITNFSTVWIEPAHLLYVLYTINMYTQIRCIYIFICVLYAHPTLSLAWNRPVANDSPWGGGVDLIRPARTKASLMLAGVLNAVWDLHELLLLSVA